MPAKLEFIKDDDVVFEKLSMWDRDAKVFYHGGEIFRAIYSRERAKLYTDLLNEEWFTQLFNIGLIKTSISKKFQLENAVIILQHETVPFHTTPGEWTSKMLWMAAKTMTRINLELSRHGYLLKDGHSWNLGFLKGVPVFIDFGSIEKMSCVSGYIISGIKQYFAVPIWMVKNRISNRKRWRKIALEYRKEHVTGVGHHIFNNRYFDNLFFWSFGRIAKHANDPPRFFSKFDLWLNEHEPDASEGDWSYYDQVQNSMDPLQPITQKQKFVHSVLSRQRPLKVLDCAANKGYFSKMAALLGSSVVAFDYDESCVDECQTMAEREGLDITPTIMDFKYPTPSFGEGLNGGSAFKRFSSDIVVALSLMHHLCVTQGISTKLFCDICMRYAKKGVILDFPDPQDKHANGLIKQSGFPQKDYCLNDVRRYFSAKFSKVEIEKMDAEGCIRTYMYFHG
jgi:hypothetical protein